MRRAIIILVVCSLCRAVGAQDEDDAITLALFAEGRAFVDSGDFAHACEKFEAARKRSPWLGIELNLADCYERLGKSASAWVLFRKASDDADKVSDARATYARERADRLEPRLARITIHPDSNVEIRLDHKPLVPGTFDVALPADPGEHLVEATAPGSVTWSLRVIAEPERTITIVVPHLVAQPAPVEPSIRIRPRRRLAFSLAGAGGLAIGSALLLGLDAKRTYDAALLHCDPQLMCDGDSYASIRTAHHRGDIATIVGGAGLGAVAAAAIVYLWAPIRERGPTVVPLTNGIGVRGAF